MDYIVKQGDCLSSIAARFGFADWHVIYDHPSNADFKAKRPNPNLIYPGDPLFIPEKEINALPIPSGKAARFKVKTSTTRLRLKLIDMDGQPFANVKYTLTIFGEAHQGETGPDGMIDRPIPGDATGAELLLDDKGIRKQLVLGGLDPVETVSGYQGRLKNMGYDCGPVDGIAGEHTRRAVRAFQSSNPPLVVDGICGPKTQGILSSQYGC